MDADDLKYPRRSSASSMTPNDANSGAGGHREASVMVMGQDGVGKSAIVVRFMTKRFIGDYDPHSENLYTVHAPIDGKLRTLRILDTAGPDEDNPKREEQLQTADGVMIVFSVVDRHSFESVKATAEHVTQSRDGRSTAILLVGNKSDLTHLRTVSTAEAGQLSSELECPYVEVSAGENYGSICSAFALMFKEIRSVRKRDRIRKLAQTKASKTSKKMSQIRETLKGLTEFRIRTSTF